MTLDTTTKYTNAYTNCNVSYTICHYASKLLWTDPTNTRFSNGKTLDFNWKKLNFSIETYSFIAKRSKLIVKNLPHKQELHDDIIVTAYHIRFQSTVASDPVITLHMSRCLAYCGVITAVLTTKITSAD